MIGQYGILLFIPVVLMLVLMAAAGFVLIYELFLSYMWENKDDE